MRKRFSSSADPTSRHSTSPEAALLRFTTVSRAKRNFPLCTFCPHVVGSVSKPPSFTRLSALAAALVHSHTGFQTPPAPALSSTSTASTFGPSVRTRAVMSTSNDSRHESVLPWNGYGRSTISSPFSQILHASSTAPKTNRTCRGRSVFGTLKRVRYHARPS